MIDTVLPAVIENVLDASVVDPERSTMVPLQRFEPFVTPQRTRTVTLRLVVARTALCEITGLKTATVGPSPPPRERDVPAGEYVLLSVRDTGPGMDEATSQRIFEPFFTTKTHGTGLGLASCYGIVKQLGGHIRVRSRPGQGATFEVFLPRTEEEPPSGVPEPAPASGGQETLLVVEDDPLVRESLRRALMEKGYTVLAAQDGEQALEVTRQYPSSIALLVTDVVMPKLGGFQLAERIQALRPGLRTLFVSGHTDETAFRKLDLGAPAQFLAKPYSLDELARCVRELLGR